MCQNSILFKMTFHSKDGPHCIYPFIHQRTLELLPSLDYYEQWCYEHGWTNISSRHWFPFFCIYTQKWNCWIHKMIIWCLIFFLRNHQIVFHNVCTTLHSHFHCTRVPSSATHFNFSLSFGLSVSFLKIFIVAILMAVRWYALLLFKLLQKAWCLLVTIWFPSNPK